MRVFVWVIKKVGPWFMKIIWPMIQSVIIDIFIAAIMKYKDKIFTYFSTEYEDKKNNTAENIKEAEDDLKI